MTILKVLLIVALAGAPQDQNEELFSAARKGDVAAVRALLAKGVNVNAKTQYGATALSYACDRGNVEMVKLLLESGADPNAKDTFYGEVPLGWALYKGHAEIVKLLLEKGALGKDRALMTAAQSGKLDLAKAVLDVGGVKQEVLNSALSKALAGKFTEVAELLKKAGAQPAAADFQVDPDTLKSYTGTYSNEQVGILTFTFQDGKLLGQLTGSRYSMSVRSIRPLLQSKKSRQL
ncbi:MAG TPA: ankyrin repeat domain-containing protein [Blastocatellia bacterium]|nr:ankyrin repeat domain-containing protein [Blastocatellia bacterium]